MKQALPGAQTDMPLTAQETVVLPGAPMPDRPLRARAFDALLSAFLTEPGLPVQAAILAVVVGGSTALRFAVDHLLPAGFPFLTFFPAVLLVSVFASVPAGIVAAFACGFAAWFWFIPPGGTLSFAPPALVAMLFYVLVTATELFFIAMTARALRRLRVERDRADALATSRDLMFSELQHRVSNNLATVGALLRMQSGRVESPEARQALLEATQRLNTVARIQRSLYAPDTQDVEVGAFLQQMAQDTVDSGSEDQGVALSVQSATLRLAREQAIPFGLVATEMVMNALEHGVPAEGKPEIAIAFTLEPPQDGRPGQAVLAVSDNGPGLPPGYDATRPQSLGLNIATQFARQLGGSLALRARPEGGGTRAELRFPVTGAR